MGYVKSGCWARGLDARTAFRCQRSLPGPGHRFFNHPTTLRWFHRRDENEIKRVWGDLLSGALVARPSAVSRGEADCRTGIAPANVTELLELAPKQVV